MNSSLKITCIRDCTAADARRLMRGVFFFSYLPRYTHSSHVGNIEGRAAMICRNVHVIRNKLFYQHRDGISEHHLMHVR
jgi:hypothetical protein